VIFAMETVAGLLDAIVAHGIPDHLQAERTLRATLSVLGERLTDDEAAALSKALPAELAPVLDRSEYDGDFSAADFFERTRRRLPASPSPGKVREAVEVVLQALGTELDEESRGRLVRALPVDLSRHLVPIELGEPRPHMPRPPAHVLTTLATGRPGSQHPLAESAPAPGHTHSVAANDAPHAETKLSSARGLTQERHEESLATGRPPQPAHPVTETSD
jgi:uncharacterized protein (DUF2267 family)